MLKLFEDAMRLPAMILPSRWQALEWRDGECPKILADSRSKAPKVGGEYLVNIGPLRSG